MASKTVPNTFGLLSDSESGFQIITPIRLMGHNGVSKKTVTAKNLIELRKKIVKNKWITEHQSEIARFDPKSNRYKAIGQIWYVPPFKSENYGLFKEAYMWNGYADTGYREFDPKTGRLLP